MQFTFPQEYDEFKSVSSIEDLREKIDRKIKAEGLSFTYHFKRRRNKYIYAYCSGCKSSLRYKLDAQNQLYVLISIQPFHNHKVKRIKYAPIQEYIKSLPPLLNKSQMKQIVLKQFQITKSRFYYIYNKVLEKKQTFQDLLNELDSAGCFVHYQPFNNTAVNPELMIIVTPDMKEYFKKFGNYISIDYTFNLFRDLHDNGNSYKAGFILGSSFSRRIVPYAIIIALNQSKQTYYRTIKSFGEIMGSLPRVIFTDQTLGAIHAIKQLQQDRQFEGIHALDAHHILKNIRQKLVKKQNIKYFANLIRAEDTFKFQLLVDHVQGLLEDQQMNILSKFLQNSSKYCISRMENQFFCSLPTTGCNQKAHDLLKEIVPRSKPFSIVINRMMKLSQTLLNKCQFFKVERVPIENFLGCNEIRLARLELDFKIFKSLCIQFSKSMRTQISMQRNRTIVLDYEDNKRYPLQEAEYFNKSILQCPCSYQIKLGIPCRHQIRHILISHSRLLDYVNPFWILSNWISNINAKKKITGRKTRRRS